MQKIMDFLSLMDGLLRATLQNLDASLFQNIILGILAIFIPFAIVFLTDVLDSDKKRSEFEKMVLSQEVLGAKKVFWITVFGIGVLAFLSGRETPDALKLLAILVTVLLVISLGRFFNKTLRFSEGYKAEFEISFLTSLSFSRFLPVGRKLKAERMQRAWVSFWSEDLTHNEREHLKIFIKHVDAALKLRKYDLAISLSKAYQQNLNNREHFSTGNQILPKIFEWHEILRNAEKQDQRFGDLKTRILETISSKHLPTFKNWVALVLKKIDRESDVFWDWHHFQNTLFPAVSKVLLFDRHGSYQFFNTFKKSIRQIEGSLDQGDEADRTEHWNYLQSWFSTFCPMYFENIQSVPHKYDIWEHYFPSEWKVAANSTGDVPRIVLHEFLRWSQPRILSRVETDFDKELTEVVGGIFPVVHQSLFPAFLLLYLVSDVKYVVQNKLSFHVIDLFSYDGEKSRGEVQLMFQQRDSERKSATVDLIMKYFSHWRELQLSKEDISEEDSIGWKSYPEKKRETILAGVRKRKLQRLMGELVGDDITDLCKSDSSKHQRSDCIELVQLLLDKVTPVAAA